MNKLTVIRGEVGGDKVGGKGDFQDIYEGHMDKAKEGRFKGGRWRWVVCGEVCGLKMETIVLEKQ